MARENVMVKALSGDKKEKEKKKHGSGVMWR